MTSRERIANLDDLARNDPNAAHAACNELLAESLTEAESALVHQARGMARRELGDMVGSESDLELALEQADTAERNGGAPADLWAQCALSLGSTRLYRGQVDAAISLLRDAVQRATGVLEAHALSQLGSALAYAGEEQEALGFFAQALPLIRQHERTDWEAGLLYNRAALHLETGAYAASLADSQAARECFSAIGNPMGAAMADHNKAVALYRLGNIADAMVLFGSAEKELVALGVPKETLFLDKSEVLLAAGFFEDALEAGQVAEAFFEHSGDHPRRIEAHVVAGDAALALGDPQTAEAVALTAQTVPGADDLPAWAARARLIELRARLATGRVDAADVETARELALNLDKASQGGRSLQASLVGARIALHINDPDAAEHLISAIENEVQRGPFHLQIERWSIAAALHHRQGDSDRCLEAVNQGLTASAALQSSTGSFEARVHAGRHAEELVTLGVDTHRRAGDLDALVTLVQRQRAAALRWSVVTDTSDERLQQALADLRKAEALEHPDAEIAALQKTVSELSRLQDRGSEAETSVADVRPGELALTYVGLGDEVIRIAQTADTAELTSCGAASEIAQLIDHQAFCGRQLAKRRRLSPTAGQGLVDRFDDVSAELASTLLPSTLAERVILNPPATWGPVAWGAFPGLAETAHVLAPSLALTQRALPPSFRNPVCAGASELEHVPVEVREVAAQHLADALIDPDDEVLARFADADLAHLAGHFVSAGSNPLFNQVRLGGVSMSGHDILAMRHVPPVTVLSACSTGRHESVGGAELGYGAALLARGGASVIVSQSLVEDGPSAVHLMSDLHRRLADGVGPAIALRDVRRHCDPDESTLSAGWLVLGTGWQ